MFQLTLIQFEFRFLYRWNSIWLCESLYRAVISLNLTTTVLAVEVLFDSLAVWPPIRKYNGLNMQACFPLVFMHVLFVVKTKNILKLKFLDYALVLAVNALNSVLKKIIKLTTYLQSFSNLVICAVFVNKCNTALLEGCMQRRDSEFHCIFKS